MSNKPISPDISEAELRKFASRMQYVAQSSGLLAGAEQLGRKAAGLSYHLEKTADPAPRPLTPPASGAGSARRPFGATDGPPAMMDPAVFLGGDTTGQRRADLRDSYNRQNNPAYRDYVKAHPDYKVKPHVDPHESQPISGRFGGFGGAGAGQHPAAAQQPPQAGAAAASAVGPMQRAGGAAGGALDTAGSFWGGLASRAGSAIKGWGQDAADAARGAGVTAGGVGRAALGVATGGGSEIARAAAPGIASAGRAVGRGLASVGQAATDAYSGSSRGTQALLTAGASEAQRAGQAYADTFRTPAAPGGGTGSPAGGRPHPAAPAGAPPAAATPGVAGGGGHGPQGGAGAPPPAAPVAPTHPHHQRHAAPAAPAPPAGAPPAAAAPAGNYSDGSWMKPPAPAPDMTSAATGQPAYGGGAPQPSAAAPAPAQPSSGGSAWQNVSKGFEAAAPKFNYDSFKSNEGFPSRPAGKGPA